MQFVTQRCYDLLVVTEHESLVKIFGDRTLEEIVNVRLVHLKQPTLLWPFSIMHMLCSSKQATDTTSYLSPLVSVNTLSINDQIEHALPAAIQRNAAEIFSCRGHGWLRAQHRTIICELFYRLLRVFFLHLIKTFPTLLPIGSIGRAYMYLIVLSSSMIMLLFHRHSIAMFLTIFTLLIKEYHSWRPVAMRLSSGLTFRPTFIKSARPAMIATGMPQSNLHCLQPYHHHRRHLFHRFI